jgi:hypothetical protein
MPRSADIPEGFVLDKPPLKTFEVQHPDGRTFEVQAPDMKSAADAISSLPPGFVLDRPAPKLPEGFVLDQPPGKQRGSGGLATQAFAGLATGAEAIPGFLPTLASWAEPAVESAAKSLGLSNPEAVQERENLQALIAGNRNGGIAQYFPAPQTTAERYTRAATSFVPAMVGAAPRVAQGVAGGVLGGLVKLHGTLRRARERRLAGLRAPVWLVGSAAVSWARNRRQKLPQHSRVQRELRRACLPQRQPSWMRREQPTTRLPSVLASKLPHRQCTTLTIPRWRPLQRNSSRQRRRPPSASFRKLPRNTERQRRHRCRHMTGVKTAERGPATGQEIEAVQKQLRAVRPNPTTPGDSAAAKQARGIIDEVLAGLPDEAILNGDAAAFRQNILAGRGNTAAMYRMRALDAADECADLNASTAYSGGNVENAGRQSFKSLVRPRPKPASMLPSRRQFVMWLPRA